MKYVEIFEGERAANYDDFIQTWIINYQFVIDTLPKLIEQEQPKAKEILVVGCGTGNELLSLSNYTASWNITGIDPSPDMVKIAREKLKNHSKIKIILGEVQQLVSNKKYDVATLFLVLHFMKDDGTKEALLQGVFDNLKQGATFILLDVFGAKDEFAFNIKLLEKLLPKEVEGMVVRERIASMPERIYPISEERLSELAKNVGFSKPIRFFQSTIYGGWIFKK